MTDVPAGMRVVSRDEFYRALMAEKRDIHPCPERLHTDWLFNHTTRLWGWHSRGYASPAIEISAPAVYALLI